MTNAYQFYCRVYESGMIKIDVTILINEYYLLNSIILGFSTISELIWIKNEIIHELNKEGVTYTGLNTLKIGVNRDIIELSHNYDSGNIQYIPTSIVLSFIDNCIAFHKIVESGGIPSLIPLNKMDKWSIVPNEYIKDEWWELKKQKESGA